MSVAELKEEAIRQFAIKVESAEDEAVLKIIIDFLGGIRAKDTNGISLSKHYDSIKSKYGPALKRLAE